MIYLKEFAARQSEEAFRTLVGRHIDFVYSVALRQLRDPHAAEEVAQAVFIDLAAKAAVISERTILSGWLFRAARFAAAKMVRAEVRRQRREREAAEMETTIQTETDSAWEQMEPLLNEALEELPEKDRCAVLLRFFEKKPLKDVAARMGLNEAAAKKRVSRAVEKLRFIFQKRGVVVPSAVLLAALSTPALQAAPAGLVSAIATAAVLKGTTLTTSTFALKGILKLMALSKIKIAAAATVALVLAGGTTTYVIQKSRQSKPADEAGDAAALKIINSLNSGVLDKAPPLVFLRATRPPYAQFGLIEAKGKMMGKSVSIEKLLSLAYGANQSRLVASMRLPDAKYDFLVSLPAGQKGALRQAIREKVGLIGRQETREKEVYVLKSKAGDFPGLQPSLQEGTTGSTSTADGNVNFVNGTIAALSNTLEQFLGRPVVNEAKLNGRFDISLTWDGEGTQDVDSLEQALKEQLGLEVTADKRDVEMLIVKIAR